jgi:predicted metal-dependent peptidase
MQRAIYELLQKEPFFAHFILRCKIVYDNKKVPTAGVLRRGSEIEMAFNTEFLEKLSVAQVSAVIKHEVMHLLFMHLSNRWKKERKHARLLNVAMDCAINQYIDDLPESAVTLKAVEKAVGRTLEPLQSTDYYFDAIMQKREEMENSGLSSHDSHDFGDDGEGKEGDNWIEDVIAASIRDMARKAIQASAGNVPSYVSEAIGAMGEPELPWKQILRNFIFSRVTNKTKASLKRPNRRFDLPVPGRVKIRKLTLAVCTDSSGSISDEQYASFINEIKSIAKTIPETWWIHADCEVQKVDRISSASDVKPVRHGYGGTAYQPAIDEAMRKNADVIVYFGDFDTSDTPTNPGVPFLWVGVGNSPAPAEFGKVLRIRG